MNIIVENIWTYIKVEKELDKELIKAIEKEMSYTIQEYVKFRKTYVDFEFSLFDKDKFRYPTGLFTNLKKVLEEKKVDFNIIDSRNRIQISSNLKIHGKKLRDYQEDTIVKAIESERGVIKGAAGTWEGERQGGEKGCWQVPSGPAKDAEGSGRCEG